MLPVEPTLIKGGLAVDARGTVTFVNDFNFESVKRFYIVENHNKGDVRVWHGHKIECKFVHILSGSAVLACVPIDNWDVPSKNLEIKKFVISAKSPSVVFIPPGYANNFMPLTDDCRVMFFSNLTVPESQNDDYRYEPDYWSPWDK